MNPSIETDVWDDILHSLSGRWNHQTLQRWFGPIQFESLDSVRQVIHLRAPNEIIKDWVISNYSKVLNESLNDLRLNGYSVGWAIGARSDTTTSSLADLGATDSVEEAKRDLMVTSLGRDG